MIIVGNHVVKTMPSLPSMPSAIPKFQAYGWDHVLYITPVTVAEWDILWHWV